MEFASKYVYIPTAKSGVATRSAGPVQADTAPPLQLSVPEESDSEQPKSKLQPKLLIPAETPRQNGLDGAENSPSLKRTLSVKGLLNETKEVVDWHGVGLQLDITPADLNRITDDHSTAEKRKAKMYEFWLANDPNASWEKLSDSLQLAGFYCLSQKIRKEYVDPPDEPQPKVRFNLPDAPVGTAQATEIDTNVLAIKFKILGEPKPLHTGDAVVCTNKECGAVLNSISVISECANDKVWSCEFCGTENIVDVVNEEIPQKNDVQFLISPGPVQYGARGAYYEEPTGKNALVVFCVDISGSMGVTSGVKGKFELKDQERLNKLYRQYSDGHIQYTPGERRDITYVSRMQSVQGAIDHQFSSLAKTSPSQKVALVTFNNEVTIAGDGKLGEVTVSGDRLSNFDELVKIGEELVTPSAISRNREYLSKTVMDLEESGQTALGPALLLSIVLAGKAPGSRVIICTDGVANTGVGSLEDISNHEKLQVAEEFYSKLGTLARDKSVSVSVLTIKGTETRLLELGRVADISKGRVNVVDPAKVKEEFTSILATPVVATEVKAQVILHYDLCVRGSKESLIRIPVGNVSTNTELTYEFEPRKKEVSKQPTVQSQTAKPAADGVAHSDDGGASIAAASQPKSSPPPVMVGGKPFLPFQLQIEFTAPDKSRYLRVVTDTRPFTSDLEEAEINMWMPVMGLHSNRMCRNTLSYECLGHDQDLDDRMRYFKKQRDRGIPGSKTTVLRLEQLERQKPAFYRSKHHKLAGQLRGGVLESRHSDVKDDEMLADVTSGMNESWAALQERAHTISFTRTNKKSCPILPPRSASLNTTVTGRKKTHKEPTLRAHPASVPAAPKIPKRTDKVDSSTLTSNGGDAETNLYDKIEEKTSGSEKGKKKKGRSWLKRLWNGGSS